MMKNTKFVAPDGGWGWMACFGVSLINLSTRSIEPSFGLLFGDVLKDLNVGTTGAAVIMSTLDVMMNFSGLFVGPLLKEFSYRKVAIAGAILCGLGLALTSPASSMLHIIATYSIINGIGVGLATSAAFVALNHYFRHKRGQAVGLSMAGTALGMLILPQLVRILLDAFGFRGAVLLLSGLALHAAVGATLLQPIKWHLKEEPIDIEMLPLPEIKEVQKEDDAEDDLPELQTLLFTNPTKKLRKNFSEIAMGSNSRASSNNTQPGNLNGSGAIDGMPKRPTFQRIMSNASNVTSLAIGGGGGGGAGSILSSELSLSIRKRKVSVMSQLSQLDFNGSNLLVHMNIGDEEAEKHERVLRRVNTALGNMSSNRESYGRLRIPTIADNLDKHQQDIIAAIEIEADAPEERQNFWKRFITLLDVDILKDPIYLNILFGLSIFYVAEMNFKMITPFFFANMGYSKTEVAYCLSVAAITDIAARVILPPICDYFKIQKRLIFLISIIFVGITRSILAEQTEWSSLMIWLSICGFFRGSALANFTLTVSEYCSLERLPAAFGWHLIGKAIFVTFFGPLIGVIRDVTGSYPICIHSQTFCISLCCIAWFIEYIYMYFRKKNVSTTIQPPTTELYT